MEASTLRNTAVPGPDAEHGIPAPFTPADYIQMASLGKYSVQLDVRGEGVEGTIILHAGQLWSAADGSTRGLPALRRLVFAKGVVAVCTGAPEDPGLRNLPDVPWEPLLLNLARQEDELVEFGESAGTATNEHPVTPEHDERAPLTSNGCPHDHTSTPVHEHGEEYGGSTQPGCGEETEDAAEPKSFSQLMDDAYDALFEKDFRLALKIYQRLAEMQPSNTVIRSNIGRLRQLVGMVSERS